MITITTTNLHLSQQPQATRSHTCSQAPLGGLLSAILFSAFVPDERVSSPCLTPSAFGERCSTSVSLSLSSPPSSPQLPTPNSQPQTPAAFASRGQGLVHLDRACVCYRPQTPRTINQDPDSAHRRRRNPDCTEQYIDMVDDLSAIGHGRSRHNLLSFPLTRTPTRIHPLVTPLRPDFSPTSCTS